MSIYQHYTKDHHKNNPPLHLQESRMKEDPYILEADVFLEDKQITPERQSRQSHFIFNKSSEI